MSTFKYYKNGQWNYVNGTITGDTVPIGSIIEYGTTTAPTGWLVCDGSYVSKTEYSELYSAIGDAFLNGGTAPSGKFRLPDLQGRVPVGYKSSDNDFKPIGKTGGEKTHTLTTQEMPSHRHTVNYSNSPGTSVGVTAMGTKLSDSSQIVQATGGGEAHNNLQPYQVVCYIIKAKQSAGVVANVSDTYSTSETDTYSCDYINNKITGTQLWVNPSLGAAFGAQTISVDLSPYKYVELVYYRFPSATTPMFRIFTRVGDTSQLNYCDYDQSTVRAWIRQFEVKSTGIEFKNATINGTTDNSGLVPGKIIGHK